jgi:tRNA A-37 threonylcarbamoyl transferase component Bud32
MTARNEDFLFAQEAQALGYVSEQQVEEGFLLQRRMADDLKIDERLAVILVKRGWMAEEQAKRVMGMVEPEGARSQIEGYRLVQMVGRGAMGTVYKAIHKGLHRVVAIKILRRDLVRDKTQIERLRREAKLLADLDHPNIVRAFDAGESNGFPFLVMEYVEGETLRDRINREGALSNEEALRITRALADALERARRMGVVHRDVKPGNVLMSTSGTPKLMDLGLAKGPLDMGLTQHGATVGTPQFISPEQAQDPRRADTRSDIYSLGASLYTMVTSRPPFEGTTLAEIITKVLYQQPVPPRVRNAAVSPEVGHLIERMMLKDPSLRYQTPAQVVADIDLIRGGQSIVPKGFQGNWEAYLLRQQARKRQRWMMIGAAAVLLLAVGTLLFLNKARRDRAQALVDQLASEALLVERVQPDDDLAELQGKLEDVARRLREIRELEREDGAYLEDEATIKFKLDAYDRNHHELARLQNQMPSIGPLRERGDFRGALGRVKDFLGSIEGRDLPPARRRAEELVAAITAESDAHWQAAQQAVADRTWGTLDEFVRHWRDMEAAVQGPYVVTKAWQQAKTTAGVLEAAALSIVAEVRAVGDAFLGSAVDARIRRLAFFDLVQGLSARRRAAEVAVMGHHRAFRGLFPLNRLTGGAGIVTVALDEIEHKFRTQVDDFWRVLEEECRSKLPVVEALDRLEAFEDACARGNAFPQLAGEARRLRDRLSEEHSRRIAAARERLEHTRSAVLGALRRGEGAAIRATVDEALDSGELDARRRRTVERMRVAADALDNLHELVLPWLKSQRSVTDVRTWAPDGSVTAHRRWQIVSVDEGARELRVRVPRRGSSRAHETTIPLRDVLVETLAVWAAAAGHPLAGEALHGAILELATLEHVHDDPGRDLRKLVRRYDALMRRLVQADPAGTWHGLVMLLRDTLRGYQEERERQARRTIQQVNWAVTGKDGNDPRWLRAQSLYEQLANPEGKLRDTDEFEKNQRILEDQAALARRELAQQDLLRRVPGAGVESLQGGRYGFIFDFDDEMQMQNFDRVLGALEAYRGKAVTPTGSVARRLHLLRGMEGVVRDRPLSIESMFDPHVKIVVEFKMFAPRSLLLAIDIDGVQVAICSADPTYWKWRFPSDAPLLEGENKLPEYDFHGRGRGIAFHAGPDFGPEFPQGNWDWHRFSRGEHHGRWADPAWLEKYRSRLFAFEPGREYKVRVVRTRGTIELWVDGELIAQKSETIWTHVGGTSDIDPKTRRGSGRIQILTWTPMAIDDLVLEGTVRKSWRERKETRKRGEAGK